MKYFFKKQWILIIVIVIFYLVFFIYYNKTSFSQKLISLPLITESTASSTVQAEITSPVRLKIPTIEIDTIIEHVGLTSDGAMGVPKNNNNVAWYNLGPLPGTEGSAVIAGHLDGKNGQKAVFYNLKKLKKGDQIFIEDSQKKIITFVVKEIRIYDSETFAPEIFTSSQGKHLNLITCSGNWNKYQKKYTQRLVVFTDLE